MNNFFYTESDFALFKKALRSTKNEPVIINILSTDSSLGENGEASANKMERKNMSARFRESPFGESFGPRKRRTEPLDMKDFSSWKNKNYRESERQLGQESEETTRFSFSDFLNSKAKDSRYNDEDTLKSESQKPIDQLSSDDETYKKFSLDSYLSRLEQQAKVSSEFAESGNLLEPLEEQMQNVVPTSEQDENFGGSSEVDIQTLAFDENLQGEKFSFEKEELDKVKNRIDKMERAANNIKEKQTSKVISKGDIDSMTGAEDDDFSLDKLGIEVDDIEKVNESKMARDDESVPKVERKRFFEVNKNDKYEEAEIKARASRKAEENKTEVSAEDEENIEELLEEFGDETKSKSEKTEESASDVDSEPETDEKAKEIEEESEDLKENDVEFSSVDEDEIDTDEDLKDADAVDSDKEEEIGETEQSDFEGDQSLEPFESGSVIKKPDEALTRAEFKDFTEEFMGKFSELYKETAAKQEAEASDIPADYEAQYPGAYGPYQQQTDTTQILQQQQAELQSKIIELLEHNKQSDADIAEKLRLAELEKQNVAKEYEARLKELEQSFREKEEEARQRAYIEKLKSDIKQKKTEANNRIRAEKIKEFEKINSEKQKYGEKLRSELKNAVSVSNLEMDNKLLECATKFNKENQIKDVVEEFVQEQGAVEEKQTKTTRRTTRTQTTRTQTTRKKSTARSHSHTRTPRRKIDSDIIGGINFD